MHGPDYPTTLIIAFAFFLTACASTSFTGIWRDENYTGAPIKSVMIVGVSENQHDRAIFENALVKAFSDQGVDAVPSIQAMGSKKFTEEDIMNAATSNQVQTVLVTRLVGIKEGLVYYPPTVNTVPYPYYRRWGTYYPHLYDYTGYVAKYKSVNLETNIYDVAEKKLIWSGASETFNPQEVNKVVDELAIKLVKELKHSKLL